MTLHLRKTEDQATALETIHNEMQLQSNKGYGKGILLKQDHSCSFTYFYI